MIYKKLKQCICLFLALLMMFSIDDFNVFGNLSKNFIIKAEEISENISQNNIIKTEKSKIKEKISFTSTINSKEENSRQSTSENDSTYLKTLKTVLYKGADKTSDNSYTWRPSTSTKGHRFVYRISYSISGQDEIDAGKIKFTIPKSILIDRNGSSADEYEMSIPTKADAEAFLNGEGESLDDDINFAYYEDGDNIIIYNFRTVPAGDDGYIEMDYYTTKTTFNYVDGQSYIFSCLGQITNDNGTVSQKITDPISVKFDTQAEITSTEKEYPDKYTSWKLSWGDTIKPENDSDYVYLVWRIESKINATQPYSFTLDDSVKGETEFMTNSIKIIGYKFEGGSWQTSNSVDNQTLYSNNNSVARRDYVMTAIKKSNLNSLQYWKITNNIKVSVSSIDDNEKSNEKDSRVWTWQKPVFEGLSSGSFKVYKRADGTYRTNEAKNIFYGAVHYAEDKSVEAGDYSRYDLEDFSGYDGSKKILTEYDGLDYASWISGYGYPWTYDYENYSSDGKDAEGYGKVNLDYELDDSGIYLFDATQEQDEAQKTDILTSEDFSYYRLNYSYYFKDAVWNEEEQKFDTTKNISFQENETIKFYGKFGNSNKYVLFTTHNLQTGEIWFDDTYVESIDDGNIYFKDNADMVAYKLKTSNTHYYTELYTVPYAKLKNSKTVMDFVKDKSEVGIVNTNKGYVYSPNYKHGTYVISDEDKDSENLIFSASESDTNYIRTTQRDSSLTKEVLSVSNDTKQKYYQMTWSVKAEETATTSAEETIPIVQTTGTFFDLLPKGSTLDKDSIRIHNGTNYLDSSEYTIKTIDNYKNTGRAMLIVKIKTSGDYYQLIYNTLYSWDSINDYGDNVYNPIAYKTGNSSITNGFIDNGGTKYASGEVNPEAIRDSSLMSGLDEIDLDKNITGNASRYIFAEENFDVTTLTSASSGLKKKVKEDEDSDWSYSSSTKINSSYAYRLRYQNSNDSEAKDMIFFDSLENYKAENSASDWHGTLQSIDTSQLEAKGIAPVIYISTIENLNIEENHNLSDPSVWTKVTKDADLSTAKAVAIDMRKTTDGKDYVLSEGESVVAYLYMKAPESAPETQDNKLPYAYNNVYMENTVCEDEAQTDESFLIHQDYTKISLSISANFGLYKTSSESQNIKIANTTFKLYGTSDYGTEYNQIFTTNKAGEIWFEGVEKGEYILQEQSTTDDWLLNTEEHKVTIDDKGRLYIDGIDYTDQYIYIENSPRVHSDIEFRKVDYSNNNKKIEGSQFKLSGVSDYGSTILEYSKSKTNGTVSFSNIEKGTYELVETSASVGYELNPNIYQVNIDEDGNFAISLKDQKSSADLNVIEKEGAYLICNIPLQTVFFYKASSWDNQLLKGAEFSLKGTSNNGVEYDLTSTSDENGRVEFKNLEDGIYTLQEINAPEGYMINTKKYIIEVNSIKDGETGENFIINELSNNEAVLDGKVLVFYNSPESGALTITKQWDDGEDDRDINSLDITIEADKTTSYYASHTITFDANDNGTFDNKSSSNIVSYGVSENGEIAAIIKGEAKLPTKKGYRFICWNGTDDISSVKSYWTTNKDGSGTKYYSTKAGVSLIDSNGNTPTLTDDITLYAQYEEYPHTLEKGTSFDAQIPNTATSIVFTDEEAPEGVTTTDVSSKQNGSVVAWLDGTTWYVSSQAENEQIIFNSNCYNMFYNQSQLKSIGFGNHVDTSAVTNMYAMFSGCKSLESLDLSTFDTSKATDMSYMFSNCEALTSLNISDFVTNKVTDMSKMFNYCKSLTSIDVTGFDTSNVTNMSNMFTHCDSITSLDVTHFNTAKITNMDSMFSACSKLTALDLSNFDTSNVTVMSSMFFNCTNLSSLDLSSFNTAKVKKMNKMFFSCSKLASVNLSNFDVSNVITMNSMFYYCESLTKLDLSNFVTNSLTDMDYIFNGCSKLTSLDISNFVTDNVTTMTYAFSTCKKLSSLDLSSFNTSKVTNMTHTFSYCENLEEILISDAWDTKSVTSSSSMFRNSRNLPNFDDSYVDVTNAYAGEGGYLTKKE